jgi:hypothetical protein
MKVKVEKIYKGKRIPLDAELIRPALPNKTRLTKSFNESSHYSDLYLYDRKGALRHYCPGKPSQIDFSA